MALQKQAQDAWARRLTWLSQTKLARVLRRNLSEAQRLELVLANKDELEAIGRERKVEAGKAARDKQLGVLSENDKTPEPPHDTRKQLAEEAGVSTGKLAQADYGLELRHETYYPREEPCQWNRQKRNHKKYYCHKC